MKTIKLNNNLTGWIFFFTICSLTYRLIESLFKVYYLANIQIHHYISTIKQKREITYLFTFKIKMCNHNSI